MNQKPLESFFTPESVALIGASGSKNSVGGTIFHNLKNSKIRKIFPVNPNHKTISGVKAFASVKEIPEKVELAIIAVKKEFVPKALIECVEAKAKAAIIVTAGFSETGEKRISGKIRKIISENPQMRVIGPNCVGVVNNFNGLDTTFFERNIMAKPKKGTLSFISQSGALGSMILDWVGTQEFGLNKFISYGNAMDVDEADLLEYLGKDRQTKVITIYLEGARNGRKFYETAKKVSRKKPIILLKGGVHEETSKAAASHTGSLAGSEKVYEAVFKQAGIIQARDILDLFTTAKLLEKEPLPKGNRVQIITNGGGFGIVAADRLMENGLRLAKFSAKSRKRLSRELKGIKISNPLDLLGDADAARYKKAIRASLEDKNVDIVMVLALFNLPTLKEQELERLKAERKGAKKPVIVCSIGSDYTEKYLAKIEKAGFTTFEYPSIAAKALKEMSSYAEFLRKSKN